VHAIILLEGPEYYKDIQMKTFDITKLTVKLQSDSVRYRNKITLSIILVASIDRCRKHCQQAHTRTYNKTSVPHQYRWA